MGGWGGVGIWGRDFVWGGGGEVKCFRWRVGLIWVGIVGGFRMGGGEIGVLGMFC